MDAVTRHIHDVTLVGPELNRVVAGGHKFELCIVPYISGVGWREGVNGRTSPGVSYPHLMSCIAKLKDRLRSGSRVGVGDLKIKIGVYILDEVHAPCDTSAGQKHRQQVRAAKIEFHRAVSEE